MVKICEDCDLTVPEEDDLCPECWANWAGIELDDLFPALDLMGDSPLKKD